MSSLKSREEGDVLVVNFTDAKILDEARIQQIGKEMMEMAAAAESNKKLLVNFQGVLSVTLQQIRMLVPLHHGIAVGYLNKAHSVFRKTPRQKTLPTKRSVIWMIDVVVSLCCGGLVAQIGDFRRTELQTGSQFIRLDSRLQFAIAGA